MVALSRRAVTGRRVRQAMAGARTKLWSAELAGLVEVVEDQLVDGLPCQQALRILPSCRWIQAIVSMSVFTFVSSRRRIGGKGRRCVFQATAQLVALALALDVDVRQDAVEPRRQPPRGFSARSRPQYMGTPAAESGDDQRHRHRRPDIACHRIGLDLNWTGQLRPSVGRTTFATASTLTTPAVVSGWIGDLGKNTSQDGRFP